MNLVSALPKSFNCPTHGPHSSETDCGRASQLDCPKCEREAREKEQAWRRKWTIYRRWRSCGIPERFRNRRFANFKSRTHQINTVAQAVKQWATSDGTTRQGLVLLGPVGLGKTALIASAFAAIIHAGYSARYCVASQLLADLRSSFDKDSELRTSEIRDALADCGLLAIDEIGATSGSDWERETLGAIVDERYRDGGCLMLAGNIGKKDLASFIGERGADRLTEMAEVLTISGQSYRPQAADDEDLKSASDDFAEPPSKILLPISHCGRIVEKTVYVDNGFDYRR